MTRDIGIQGHSVIKFFTDGIPVNNRDDPDKVIFSSEKVQIAKAEIRDGVWRATHLACDHPCHGVHPRMRKLYAELHEKFSKYLPSKIDPADCPKCNGAGWLKVGTDEAGKLLMMATTFMMYRGVDITPEGGVSELNIEHLRATIELFLSGDVDAAPTAASENPVGSASSRVT